MCGRLDFYLDQFARLKPQKNRRSWGKESLWSSPFKPFLLLSVLDLLESESIQSNFISPSGELNHAYTDYLTLLNGRKTPGSIAAPFLQLGQCSFWQLREIPGVSAQDCARCRSLEKLRKCYFGAKFAEDLFPLLQMEGSRRKLRKILVDSYFSEEFARVIQVEKKTHGF